MGTEGIDGVGRGSQPTTGEVDQANRDMETAGSLREEGKDQKESAKETMKDPKQAMKGPGALVQANRDYKDGKDQIKDAERLEEKAQSVLARVDNGTSYQDQNPNGNFV